MIAYKEGVGGAITAEGILFWGSKFLRVGPIILHVKVEDKVEQNHC